MKKGMILAAGLGTRLRPVTDTMPKALVAVDGKPMLQHALEHLKLFGIVDVIVNVHHFPEQIMDYLDANGDFGMKITISDESGELLETGGGLKRASWFFSGNEPFVVRNVDILSDLDLNRLEHYHTQGKALATLALRDRETSRYLLFDHGMRLCGWQNVKSGEDRMSRDAEAVRRFAFSGIQVMDPAIFSLMTEHGKFSLTDLYLRLTATQRIMGYVEMGTVWRDIGNPKS